MNIIKVITKRGLELRGAIYEADKKDTVLIMVTGICSNVFQNDLLDSTGKLLSKKGIATIIAHTHDSFSCFAYSDHSIKKQSHKGTFNGDFNMVYQDVEAYIKYALDLGYKNIILAGHSLGSNKIINYLGTTNDDYVKYFIVSCPIDIMHWWSVMPNINECCNLAKKFISENRENEILPFLFGGFTPMTAKSVLGFYNADNLKNCPVLSGIGETKSLYNIKPKGSFIIGSKDSVTGESPKKFMEQLNAWTNKEDKNQVIEVEGASHIFYNMHETYAKTILDCIQNHYMADIA